MGLIKAGIGALGGVLADQWKEFFYCESIDQNTLMVKGQKQVSGRSSNTKGSDNIISNGSGIAVADGQCMIIVEQGKVVEFCAEPGEFTYDSSTEPSLFTGSLGKSILDTFKTIGKRFTYGGDTGKDQRVYYFNTKEIPNNKFGTPTPIPFRVIVDEALGFKLSVDLRCNGMYSYKITDPLLFYTSLAGNVADRYERSEIDPTLKADVMGALQPALAKVSAQKIMYYELPGHTKEVAKALQEELAVEWKEKRGIEMFSISFNSVSVPEDQRKKITEWEENAMTVNPMVGASRMVGATADAMRTAAANENGAMMGFMGMNMAGQAGGMNAQNLYQMGMQQQQMQMQQQPVQQPVQQQPSAPAQNGWKCSCGATNTGKFCIECGSPMPQQDGWTCKCGAVNKGKFCPECGSPKPAGAPIFKCDKCGWEPEDPHNPPKFCPECGDVFNDGDIIN